jgi:hypothetical protein
MDQIEVQAYVCDGQHWLSRGMIRSAATRSALVAQMGLHNFHFFVYFATFIYKGEGGSTIHTMHEIITIAWSCAVYS